MPTPYEIPFDPKPQKFQITLSGVIYMLRVLWNTEQKCWMLDVLQTDETPLITSIPLQPGTNLLAQYAHLGIPGELWVQCDGDLNSVPTFSNLGITGHLYYVAP